MPDSSFPRGDAHAELCHRFSLLAGGPASAYEIALAVACAIDADASVAGIEDDFDQLIAPLQRRQIAASELLAEMRAAGFSGPNNGVVGVAHSHIGQVIARREGIPISLAIVLIEAAQRCGLQCHGINYPGHFLVSLEQTVVDPLSMQPLGAEDIARMDVRALVPAGEQGIGLRMLNNLKALSTAARDWSRLLDLLDYQVALTGSDEALASTLHFERGEVWEQLGVLDLAREAYIECARSCPHPDLAQKAQVRAGELPSEGGTVH